jgi:hypothetical protein
LYAIPPVGAIVTITLRWVMALDEMKLNAIIQIKRRQNQSSQ